MASPSRSWLISPAVDYIDNRLSNHHPAFAEPHIHFDNSMDCYVATPAVAEMVQLQDVQSSSETGVVEEAGTSIKKMRNFSLFSFPDIMIAFTQEFPKEPKWRVEKHCSIRNMSSWDEVLDVVERTGEAYMSTVGAKGKFKRMARFVGDKADTMMRVARVVPDVSYAKPIVGALTFLLEAFKQTSKVRGEIKEGIENLSNKFEAVEDYVKLYSSKPNISKAVMTLYVSILKGIEDVIGFYTRNSAIKGLDAVWSGENYEQSLLECLQKIDENGKKLIDAANYSHMEESHEASQDIKLVVKRTDSIKDAFNNFRTMFESMAKEHAQEMDKKHKENERMHKETQRLARQVESVRVQNLQLLQQQQYFLTTAPKPQRTRPIVTQEDFLEFLSISDMDRVDMAYIMDSREAFISRGQERTDAIMKASKFRHWLVTPSSQELLIHGNSDHQPISPLSLFCAMLVQNLRDVDKFWSVVFFCGRHPYEDYGGARTLITSLIAQLLGKRSFDLSFIQHEHVYRMDSGELEVFCYVFDQLVQQIESSDTVFCIIDGVNSYEGQEETIQETAYVLRLLLDMTKGRTVFKVLLTSPSTTEDVRQAIADENYLPLPRQTSNTQVFSGLWFERQLNEKLEN